MQQTNSSNRGNNNHKNHSKAKTATNNNSKCSLQNMNRRRRTRRAHRIRLLFHPHQTVTLLPTIIEAGRVKQRQMPTAALSTQETEKNTHLP